MNKFNSVFLAIKEECEGQKGLAEISCFEKIAKKTGIGITSLPLYLNHLQEIGVIKYSLTEKYIYLTTLGKRQTTLIKEEKKS